MTSLSSVAAGAGLRFLDALLAPDPHANVVCSPASLAVGLAMLANATAGSSRAAILRALSADDLAALNASAPALRAALDELDEEMAEEALFGRQLRPEDYRVRASLANGLWLAQGRPFVPAFVETLRGAYDAEVAAVDFGDPATTGQVNGWVRERTAGCIPSLFGPFEPLTVMAMANALAFKGAWADPFSKSNTAEALFHTPAGDRPCMLMYQSADRPYAEDELAQYVLVPFSGARGGDYEVACGLLVALPRPTATPADVLAALAEPGMIGRLQAHMGSQMPEVQLWLPRLRVETGFDLAEPMSALGMGELFDPEAADFSALSPLPQVCLSQAVHKVFLEVDEEGARGGAATGFGMTTLGFMEVERAEMRVDRPFVIALMAWRIGVPIFLGSISDPGMH